MRQFQVIALLFVLLAASAGQSYSATFLKVGFDKMVEQSAVIVQGRAVKVESEWGGGSASASEPSEEDKESKSPMKRKGKSEEISTAKPARPVGVRAERGRMIFTRVTLETSDEIKGAPGRIVEFLVAGGSLDRMTVVVPGLPEFREGGQYVLFLRKGYQKAADPFIGVNQGFFRVVQDRESGREVLLNAEGNYVLGVENDHVMSRHNPQSIGPKRRLIGPPQPDSAQVRSEMSPEVRRHWESDEPPMTVGEFTDKVRARLNAQ